MSQDIETIMAEHRAIRAKLKAQGEEFDRKRRAHDTNMRLISCEMQRIIHQVNQPLYDLMRDIKNS